MSNESNAKEGLLFIAAAAAAIALLAGVIFGMWSGISAMGRHQRTANAKNTATNARIAAENEQHVNSLRINAQAQKVEIAKKDAEIRIVEAQGIKGAQDEIAKTLTPLYVQYEMIRAIQSIAESGKNSSVIVLPSGPGGIPQVFDTSKLIPAPVN